MSHKSAFKVVGSTLGAIVLMALTAGPLDERGVSFWVLFWSSVAIGATLLMLKRTRMIGIGFVLGPLLAIAFVFVVILVRDPY